MRIRLASADDLPKLIALDSAERLDPARAGHIGEWVADNACWLLVEGDEPVAYMAITHNFFHRPFIEMLMVGNQWRRHGYGAVLLDHACTIHHDLWTSTNQSNLPMRALLERSEFRPSGIVEGLDVGDPELIFRRHSPLVE